jgi:hypothetical protein
MGSEDGVGIASTVKRWFNTRLAGTGIHSGTEFYSVPQLSVGLYPHGLYSA